MAILVMWPRPYKQTFFPICNLIPICPAVSEEMSSENVDNTDNWPLSILLEAQVGQKLLTWIRMIMICYIVLWWPSWLLDQIVFSNPESDVVW